MKSHLSTFICLLLTLSLLNVKAQNKPTFTITINGNEISAICLGNAATFTNTSSSTNITWDFGDGKTSNTSTTPYQYSASGNYIITLKDNTTGQSTTKNIVVNSAPTSTYTVSSVSTCTGTLLNFSSTSSSSSTINLYKWDFGDGTRKSLTNPTTTYAYNAAGTFTPTLIVQDANGCSSSSNKNASIQVGGADLKVSFQANGNQFYSCTKEISFTNATDENGKSGINYQWDFGDGKYNTTKNPGNHIYDNPGLYNVSLKASYGGTSGCSPGFSRTVYIGKPNITINAPSSICALDLMTLQASSDISGFINSSMDVNWQLDNGNVINGGLSGYFNNIPGNSTIRATNINGCPSTSTATVNVKEAPQLNVSVIPTSGICVETEITLKAVPSNTNTAKIVSYLWDLKDGSNLTSTTADSLRHIYTLPTTYYPTVKATNTLGCNTTSQGALSVKLDCTDNGYGSTYNPIFSFISASCEDKYTITLQNKNLLKPITQWIVDGQTITVDAQQSATVKLTEPTLNEKNKTYIVQSIFSDGTKSDTKEIHIIDEKANFVFINTENPKMYCANNQFIFNTDTSVNLQNISKFSWLIQNTTTKDTYNIDGNNPTFSFPKPGNYDVTLTILDIRDAPCSSTITKNINVKGLAIDLSIDSTNFCYTTPTIHLKTHITKSEAPLQSLYWEMGDGNKYSMNTIATDTTLSYQYNYTGSNNQINYTNYIAYTDADGCKASVTRNDFIKIFNPKVSFNKVDTLLCNTRKIIIQNTSNVPNGHYEWTVGNATKTYENRSEFNYTYTTIPKPSTMDVYLKVTDAGGCTKDTLVKQYLRFADPKAAFDIANKEVLNECPSYTIVIQNKSTNSTSAQWTITDRNTSNYNLYDSIYYTIKHPGNTTIKLISYLDGCGDTTINNFTAKGPVALLNILDTVGCSPFNSRMVIQHNDDVSGYQWDLGDGTTIVDAHLDSLNHTYKSSGIYLPKVYVSGYEGCTDSLETPSSINVSHLSPSFSAFNIQDKCTNLTPLFLNTTKPIYLPINQYIWNWGDTLKENNNSKDTIRHSFSDTNLYIPVSLTAITSYCSATSDTIMISPHFANLIHINGGETFCDNVNLTLTGSAQQTPDQNNLYSWYNQNDSLLYTSKDSIFQIPSHSFTGTTIKLKLTNTFGCSNFTTQKIGILASPVITLQDSTKLCKGDTLSLNASAVGNFNWNSQSSLLNGNSSQPNIFPANSQYYYLTVTNSNHCQSIDSIWAQVDNRIGAIYQDNYKACLSDTALIPISVKTDIPSLFTWEALPTDNKVTNSTGPNIWVRPAQMTSYHFVAYSKNTCPNETGDILLQYAPTPTIHFARKIVTQPAGTVFNFNPIIENLTPNTKFTWTPDTRLDNRYQLNPTVIADKDISYTLSLLDEYGCTNRDTITVKVLCNASKILMANAFTPNGDGKNDRFYVTGYGIKNVVHFYIIDRWGKKIFERNNIISNDISQGWDGNINGKPAEAGTYFYMGELECNEGNRIPIKGSVVLVR